MHYTYTTALVGSLRDVLLGDGHMDLVKPDEVTEDLGQQYLDHWIQHGFVWESVEEMEVDICILAPDHQGCTEPLAFSRTIFGHSTPTGFQVHEIDHARAYGLLKEWAKEDGNGKTS